MITKLSRQELYDMVWSKPMTTLAKEFNLSDNGLRKICKKYDIPMPKVGHWEKVKYGHKTVIPKLSKQGDNEIKNIDINVFEKNKANPENEYDFLSKIKSNPKLILQVQNNLTKPDQLIIDSKEELEIRQKPWDHPSRKNRKSKDCLNISVSKELLPKALRIFDNMIKNLRSLNYKFVFNYSETEIMSFDNIKISISLREKCNATFVDNGSLWRTRELTYNGILCLKLNRCWYIKEFTDTTSTQLEEKIPFILAKIEELFQREREQKVRIEIEREERNRLEEIARAIQKAKEDELKKFLDFYKSAHRWDHYMILKRYYDMIQSTSTANDSELNREWLDWAKAKLDWYNPALNEHDDLLNDVDKDTLEFKYKKYDSK